MRQEIQRKDELIGRHFDKVARWQSLVQQVEMFASNPERHPPPVHLNSGAGFSSMGSRMPIPPNSMYPGGSRSMMPNSN